MLRVSEGADRGGAAAERLHRGVSCVLAALVLLQAVVAGQATFGDWEIEVHGWLGNGSFALGIALVGLTVAARAARRAVATAAALTVAMFVQVGLGYAGRTEPGAASWHIPLGVAIFGLAVFNLTAASVGGAGHNRTPGPRVNGARGAEGGPDRSRNRPAE